MCLEQFISSSLILRSSSGLTCRFMLNRIRADSSLNCCKPQHNYWDFKHSQGDLRLSNISLAVLEVLPQLRDLQTTFVGLCPHKSEDGF